MAAVANITPANDVAKLSDVVAIIVMREDEIAEIRAGINKLYADAERLGAHKAGLKLAIAHSRLKEEKREKVRDGYRQGAHALGLQGELPF